MHRNTRRGALLAALAFALLLAATGRAAAQDEGGEPAQPRQASAKGETNYEVQVQMLVTAEGAEGSPKVPQALEGVVRQLKSALPPAEYRLGAAFFNRVAEGSSLEVRSMGTSPYAAAAPGASGLTFQISLRVSEAAGAERPLRLQSFRFGLTVPVIGPNGAVVQYENVGITTQQVGVRDGEPTLVGTLNTSRPGQLFAVVLTVRRVK
jgi:hypothetical protein